MPKSEWDEKAAFLEALSLPPLERAAFLGRVCPDAESIDRILDLIKGHEKSPDEFFKITIPPESAFKPPAHIAEFKILHRLGEGGMGVVYLAEDTILNRQVALKVLASHLVGSEQALGRFHDEARNAAQLKHPAIVPVFKFGRDEERYYLVTEFVDGPTLASVIAERSKLPAGEATHDARSWHRRAAEIVATVADALDSAHRARIVHRDVKPSNILMDPERGPRLADFGIAKSLVDEERTRTALVGSCHYMSPEQAGVAGKSIDQRSDIFSLGVVLYEMLALRKPFDGATLPQVLKAVVECSPPRLRTVDRRIPRDLETICHKAMEKRPGDRYQTAAHVTADLRCFLGGDPILARPPGLGRRIALLVRRRRTVAMTVGVALVVILIAWNASNAVRNAKDDALAWVQLDTGDEACHAYLQPISPVTSEPTSEFQYLGATPLPVQKLQIGQYRLTVKRKRDGAFSEFNLVLLDRGPARQRTLLLNDGQTAYPPGACPAEPKDLGTVLIGVPRAPSASTPEMIRIPGGSYALERDTNAEALIAGPLTVKEFFIDARKVSNRDYKEFVDVTGFRRPSFWMEDDPASILDLPVYGLMLEEAEAYARWCGKRLPTLVEWQAAARGKSGNAYPGGDSPPLLVEPPTELRLQATAVEAEKQRALYVNNVRPATAPDLIPITGMPAQMYSNLRELCATVSQKNVSVIVCGRAWFDGIVKHSLGRISESPLAFPSPHNGFRCAVSSTNGPES